MVPTACPPPTPQYKSTNPHPFHPPSIRNDNTMGMAFLVYKISFGEKNYKYFIGYLYNDHKVKPLHIMLRKTSFYVKSCILIEDDDLLEKYNTIWDKVIADIKKIDSKAVYNKLFFENQNKISWQ